MIENFYSPQNRLRTSPQSSGIFDEIIRNRNVPPNRRRYSSKVMAFALAIITISLPCYQLLRSVFQSIPSRQSIDNYFKHDFYYEYGTVTKMEDIPIILNEYKKENDDKGNSSKIHLILAVDAISLTPEIRIDKNGFVYGIINNQKISGKEH